MHLSTCQHTGPVLGAGVGVCVNLAFDLINPCTLPFLLCITIIQSPTCAAADWRSEVGCTCLWC